MQIGIFAFAYLASFADLFLDFDSSFFLTALQTPHNARKSTTSRNLDVYCVRFFVKYLPATRDYKHLRSPFLHSAGKTTGSAMIVEACLGLFAILGLLYWRNYKRVSRSPVTFSRAYNNEQIAQGMHQSTSDRK
jgi:hypothetical protein